MTGRVAVIGAGFAGLACALALAADGADIDLFDKGRVPGGRCASRRNPSFDHGAQFATARGADFSEVLQECVNAGSAALWPAASQPGAPRWVGVPTMSALPVALAARLSRPPLLGRHVAWLARDAAGWFLRHHPADSVAPGTVTPEGGDLAGPYDAVALALPAPQATSLLALASASLAASARSAAYAPCWAVMVSFASRLDLPDIVRPQEGAVAWMAREGSRPGRAEWPERFVIHAAGAWSRAELGLSAPDATAALLAAAGFAEAPVAAAAHRWRYALVEQALGEPCLWDGGLRLGACGDWCLGGRIEAAWDSGRALARAIRG